VTKTSIPNKSVLIMRNHVFMIYTTLKSSISALACMSVLTLMTWNVTGIMSSLCYLEKNTVDICGISQHWLFSQHSYILDSISPNYSVHAVCDSSLNVYNKRKVGKGGVALMWRKHLDTQKFHYKLTMTE